MYDMGLDAIGEEFDEISEDEYQDKINEVEEINEVGGDENELAQNEDEGELLIQDMDMPGIGQQH